MDETDLRLCLLLMQNSRMPYRDIADKLQLSVQAVHRRFQALQDERVIGRLGAHLSVPFLGALPVHVRGISEATNLDTVLENLKTNDSISLVITAGGTTLLLQGLLRGVSDLEPFIQDIKTGAMMPNPYIGLEALKQVGDKATSPIPMRTIELRTLDYRIIHELSRDSRLPAVDIAEALGVSGKTVSRRLESMMSHGVIEFSADVEFGASTGTTALVRVKLKPDQDKDGFRSVLRERYGVRMIVILSFSNVTDALICMTWSPTSVKHAELLDELERDERVAQVLSNLTIAGYYFDTWRDRLVAERAERG